MLTMFCSKKETSQRFFGEKQIKSLVIDSTHLSILARYCVRRLRNQGSSLLLDYMVQNVVKYKFLNVSREPDDKKARI